MVDCLAMPKRVLVWTAGGECALCDALAPLEGISAERAGSRAEALAAMCEADALVTSTVLWDAELAGRLHRASRLVWIQILNAGFDNMERLGVPERVTVTTVGDIGSRVVAEHAVSLLLSLLRGLPAAVAAQRREEWDPAGVARAARTLDGLHLGILGFGHIGERVATLARAFGARLVAFARTARTAPDGTEVRSIETFLESLSALDALLVCAPLNAGTERLVDAAACAALRPGAFLVNVSRGGILDTDALVDALRRGRLGGAALDVVEPEPLPKSHPLWSLPNVLVTPHTAWAAAGGAQTERLRELVAQNARRFARGERLCNIAPLQRI